VTEPSAAEITRMREMTKPALAKFASDGHEKVIADLQAELEKVRAQK
jgi:hypothetical protein